MRPILMLVLLAAGCADVWNDPYPAADRGTSVLYTAFLERPFLEALERVRSRMG